MLRAAPASPSTPMEQTPSPSPALDSRWSNTKDGEMPCHAVQPHHDASPGQDGRKSQPLPGKRWCRLVTGGERPFRGTRRRPCLSESQRRCGGGPPPCWEASEIPPAAGHHAPQKLSASRLAPDLCGLLGDLPATPPARLEPRPSSSQVRKRDISASARVGTLVRPSLSWKGVKLFPGFNGPRTGSSVSVCLGRLTRAVMRHMAIIRAHPRWSGRSRLAKCPRPPLLLHRATSSASPPPTALLRAPHRRPRA